MDSHVVLTTSIRAASHVGHDSTVVAVRPQRPVQCHIRASCRRSVKSCRARPHDTIDIVTTTLDISYGDVGHWAVALDRTRDTLGCRGCVRLLSVRNVLWE